jgi:hypothetical protein
MEPPVFILRGYDLADALDELCLQRLRYLLKDDFIVEVMEEDVHPADIKEVKDALALVIKYLDWSSTDLDGRGYVEWYDEEPEFDKNKKISVSLDMYHTFVIITALHRMKKIYSTDARWMARMNFQMPLMILVKLFAKNS